MATAMVDAIVKADVSLPGINGDAATAATFAGHWSEQRKSAATPFQGNRLYELFEAGEVAGVEGQLRQALPRDRSLIIHWTRAFQIGIDEPAPAPNFALTGGWQRESFGSGMAENQCRWPLAEGQLKAWSGWLGSTLRPRSGSVVTPPRVFTLFRNTCVMPGIAVSCIRTLPIPRQIRFTGELGIGPSRSFTLSF